MRNQQVTIESLGIGESLLTQIRGVKNNRQGATYHKIQVEVAEKVISTERNTPQNNVLQALNKSDDRFQGGSTDRARRAWITAEPADFIEMFGSQCNFTQEEVDKIMNMGLDEIMPIGLLNPSLGGKRLRVQVIETTEPDEYEQKNPAHRAKQNGRGLYCVTKDRGALIFSHTQIVDFEPKHVFLPFDLKPFEEVAASSAFKQMRVIGTTNQAGEGVNIVNTSVPISNPALEERAADLAGGVPVGAAAEQRAATEEALTQGTPARELNNPQRQGGTLPANQQSGGRRRQEGQGGYDVPNNPAGHEAGENKPEHFE